MAGDASRVINLPDSPAGPDSSGVGKMLFDRFNDEYKMGQQAKQTDVLEGIREKYKQQSMAKANEYDIGMENLKSTLTQGRTAAAWEYEQQLRSQQAGGLTDLIGSAAAQGMPTPGLTSRSGDMESPTPQYDVAKIGPNNVDVARQMFLQNTTHQMDLAAKASGLSVEAQTSQMRRSLDLIDDSDARQAQTLAANFDLYGDKEAAGTIRALYGTPGQGSRSEWQKFQTTSVGRMQVAQANNATRMAVTESISQRMKSIAQLKVDAQKFVSQGKIDNTAYRNMGLLHDKMSQEVRGLESLHKILESNAMLATDPTTQKAIASQMRQIELQVPDLQSQMYTIRDKMGTYMNKGASPETPGSALGAAPAAADRLGILGGVKK